MEGLTLGIEVSEIFGYITQFFEMVWPILAVALGVAFLPKVIGMVRAAIGGRR